MPEIIETLVQSFNPEEVFASVRNFLSSGYVGIAVVAFIAYSVFAKVVKLIGIACVAGLIYLAVTSGMADPVFEALGML